MQTSSATQPTNALLLLRELLSSPTPIVITTDELQQKGLSKDEAECLLQIGTELTATRQQLAIFQDEANKPLLQKQQEMQLNNLKRSEESGTQTFQLITKLKDSLIENASGTLRAFNRVIVIYTAAFIMGILLMITAVVFAAMDKAVLSIAFGAIGLVDMLTYFFKVPASKIQESRSNLSQLQVVLLVWLKDFVNNDALTAANPTVENYKTLSHINIENTKHLLKLIQDFAQPSTEQRV